MVSKVLHVKLKQAVDSSACDLRHDPPAVLGFDSDSGFFFWRRTPATKVVRIPCENVVFAVFAEDNETAEPIEPVRLVNSPEASAADPPNVPNLEITPSGAVIVPKRKPGRPRATEGMTPEQIAAHQGARSKGGRWDRKPMLGVP
jgi:hypothetical protein